MDQKEIDAMFSQGSITEFNKKQDEIKKHLSEKDASLQKKGKVIGQLTKVSEESEAGTNMVMGYLENVLSLISKQQSFIKDMLNMHKENPSVVNVDEVLSYLNDNNTTIEDIVFSAMDAFQFQDIGRQKLMKVMYTLAKLNEYLNELLGGEENRDKAFGHQIEKRTLEKDIDKELVDGIVDSFKGITPEPAMPTPPMPQQRPQTMESQPKPQTHPQAQSPVPPPRPQTQPTPPPPRPQAAPPQRMTNPAPQPPPFKPEAVHTEPPQKSAPSVAASNSDVDDIIAEFQRKSKKTEEQNQKMNNDDIDSIIAEFQKKNQL